MCLWVNLEQHQCSNYQEKPYHPKTGTSPLDVIIKVLLLVLTEVSKAIARYVKTGISYTLINILGYLTQLPQNFQAPRWNGYSLADTTQLINEALEWQKWQSAHKEEKCIGTIIPKVNICDFISNRRNVTTLEDLTT